MKYFIYPLILISTYFSQTLTIYGLITNNETGESLIGANVFIENTNFVHTQIKMVFIHYN